MLSIKSLLLHKNLLAKWQDVECAATPGNLEWLTLYGNPITSQPEYQAWRLHLQSVLSLVELPELGTEWRHILFTFCPGKACNFSPDARPPCGNCAGCLGFASSNR